MAVHQLSLRGLLREAVAGHHVQFAVESGELVLATANAVSYDKQHRVIRLKLSGHATDCREKPIEGLSEIVIAARSSLFSKVERDIVILFSHGGECRILAP